MPVIKPINPPTMVWKAGVIASNIFVLSIFSLNNPCNKTATIDNKITDRVTVAIKVTIFPILLLGSIYYFINKFLSALNLFCSGSCSKLDIWRLASCGLCLCHSSGISNGFGRNNNNAFTKFAREKNAPLNTIEAGWVTNLEVRPERDWEQDKGRAVSE